ncbi:MAG TPA: bifunctional tetrahydrofolate synthase/dihydrofolate synthase [Candidatus Competibacteraceae bacterium]|nr:bifunctional tetrahydrofolate synthase/dihydrofolate synthase [Candidatus Competibacteraceae bacterium]
MSEPRFRTLAEWLAWQESLHPTTMDFGLERLRLVYSRLFSEPPRHKVITVAGTNGKGSSVAMLEAVLRAAGYRVGAYTSPHLLRYNERIRLNGAEVDDATLCGAFHRVDEARGDISLTYFEFGTLAAFLIFREAALDVAVLEVGLGGRLDAVNVVDADVALLTAIGLDHTEWLGPDRDSIGREKAGIFRPGRPAVCSDPQPPTSVRAYAQTEGVPLDLCGRDFGYRPDESGQSWSWWSRDTRLQDLPWPALAGRHQLQNAAGVLMVLQRLGLPVAQAAICRGLQEARIAGRFQVVPGEVEWILDVTHNPHGAVVLADCLAERPCTGRTLAVMGMLADKDAAAVAKLLAPRVDAWFTAGLSGPRGRSGGQLAAALAAALEAVLGKAPLSVHETVAEACIAARAQAHAGDRILVFGSFHTVAEALTSGVVGGGS